MKVQKNIEVKEIINYYPLDTLKCFERPKLIVTENLCKNSMYYRLLFNEMNYKEAFERFLEEKTGVSFSANIFELGDFHDVIQRYLDRGIPILLCIDHLYEELWKDFIPGEHEQHTVIVYGYDSDQYLLIDQDYTKDYFSASNIKQKMEYCERTISKDKLFLLASNAYQAFGNIGNLDQAHFLTFLPTVNRENAVCSWKEIERDFKKLISEVYLGLDAYKDRVTAGINEVICDFHKLTHCEKIDYDYKYNWLRYDGYAVPDEVFELFHRATTLKMYKVFFENTWGNQYWSAAKEKVNEVYEIYQLCKNLLRKAVYTNNVECCKRILPKLEVLIRVEREFYEIILNSASSFEF